MKTALSSLAEMIEGVLGVSFKNLPNTVSEAFIWMIQVVSDFVLNVAAWTSAIVQNWQLTWDIMKTYTALKLTEMADATLVAWNTIKASAIATVMATIEYWRTMAVNVVSILSAAVDTISALFSSLWEAIKAGWSGDASFVDTFVNKFKEEMSKVNVEIEGPISNAADKFNEVFTANMGPDSPLSGTIGVLKDDLNKMTGKLAEEADKIKQRSMDKAVAASNATQALAEEKKTTAEVKPEAAAAMDAGRFGFAQLGQKFQDMLLQGKDDKQGQMVDLLTDGNKKQDELIAAVKETASKPAVLS